MFARRRPSHRSPAKSFNPADAAVNSRVDQSVVNITVVEKIGQEACDPLSNADSIGSDMKMREKSLNGIIRVAAVEKKRP